MKMHNIDLILAEYQMRILLERLDRADVTVLSARIDMDYHAPTPCPFRFHIHAWEDRNFRVWARSYAQMIDVQGTRIPFGYGEVFTQHNSEEVAHD